MWPRNCLPKWPKSYWNPKDKTSPNAQTTQNLQVLGTEKTWAPIDLTLPDSGPWRLVPGGFGSERLRKRAWIG